MRIGEAAEAVGVNPKTIRYYEGIGLLPGPERTVSNYRDYPDEVVPGSGELHEHRLTWASTVSSRESQTALPARWDTPEGGCRGLRTGKGPVLRFACLSSSGI
jgi:hypothetical protein